jgi:hypothetical protein
MSRQLKKYQVWLGGSRLVDVEASSEQEARESVRKSFGMKRLPNDTCVCQTPWNYYDKMIENNRESIKGTGLCLTDLY